MYDKNSVPVIAAEVLGLGAVASHWTLVDRSWNNGWELLHSQFCCNCNDSRLCLHQNTIQRVNKVSMLIFWFKYDLGQKYQAPQVRPNQDSNSWPPDHDSTFHVTETPALTTWPSVTPLYTYPHKPLRKIKVTICNHQADSPLYVWTDVWSGDWKVLETDTEGPYWDQVSLNDTSQTKPKVNLPALRLVTELFHKFLFLTFQNKLQLFVHFTIWLMLFVHLFAIP